MAKWDLSCVEKDLFHRSHDDILLDHEQRLRKLEDQGPRTGEIRIINFIDFVDDQGNSIIRPVFQQFWDGKWSNIKVYQEDGDVLHEVKQ
jgi:hypothetical protein